MHVLQLHHLHVPVFHISHAPHLEWIEPAHPIRAALITVGITATLGAGGILIESVRTKSTQARAPAPISVDWETRELKHAWRSSGTAVERHPMVRPGAELGPDLNGMWRQRR